MAAHIGQWSLCFPHLRQLRFRSSLAFDKAHSLVRALIHSRLDYCDSLFAGLPAGQMARIQCFVLLSDSSLSSQAVHHHHRRHSSLAHLSTASHLQAVLGDLQVSTWPRHLDTWRACVCCLWSFSITFSWNPSTVLALPRIYTTSMGSCGFYHAAPASWNLLPPLLHCSHLTLSDFWLLLKTVLCQRWYLFWRRLRHRRAL